MNSLYHCIITKRCILVTGTLDTGLEKLKGTVNTIGKKYFIDHAKDPIAEEEHWKVLLGAFTYVGRKNVLLLGNKGTGKTTYAGVIGSAFSGLPYDLFDELKIQGHPEHTKETLLGYLDIGKLQDKMVHVVWQPSLYLPTIIFDELNRNVPGKQNIFLEYVRTGVAEHLGRRLKHPKEPLFATNNYNGDGTYPLTTPMLDRFDLSLEFCGGSSFVQSTIKDAGRAIKADLVDPERTEDIAQMLLLKDMSPADKIAHIQGAMESGKPIANQELLTEDERDAIVQTAEGLRWTADATTLMRCIWEEMNTTHLYGENRGVDRQDTGTHNQRFASSKVHEAISHRAWDSITFYAGMLATYQGAEEVDLPHLNAVAPHCLAHKLVFAADFIAQNEEQPRLYGERKELDLTRRVLGTDPQSIGEGTIKGNYDDISGPLKALDAYFTKLHAGEQIPSSDLAQVQDIAKGPAPDHPLMRQYWDAAREELGIGG